MAFTGHRFGEYPGNSRLSPAARRALVMLADFPDGPTDNLLLAHGFKRKLIDGLLQAGLATAKNEVVRVGERAVRVRRIMIADAGRMALEQPMNEVGA